jgi:hypothetical protein
MKPFALLLLLASTSFAAPRPAPAPAASTGTAVQTPTPPPGTLDSSKIRLDAHDDAGALADAETALANGGGADAYAARADAKRALGQPMDEVIADYAQAAKLDPRYIEKYKGLIAQKESEDHPSHQAKSAGTGKGVNGLPIAEVLGTAAVGGLLIVAGLVLVRGRNDHPQAPDDEEVKPAGNAQAAGEGHPKAADGEQPPKKEPPTKSR